MNTTKMMNLEQLKEVSGGVYHGRLSPSECENFDLIIKISKFAGMSMEKCVEVYRNSNVKDREFREAVCKYIQTFWDHN